MKVKALEAVGWLGFSIAFALTMGFVTDIGPWRVLGFSLIGACVIAGVVALVSYRKERRATKALALVAAFLLGPLGVNGVEAATLPPAPDPPGLYIRG